MSMKEKTTNVVVVVAAARMIIIMMMMRRRTVATVVVTIDVVIKATASTYGTRCVSGRGEGRKHRGQ